MKLASIEKITEISPHENADSLESAKILGFNAIVKKGVYSPGDKIIFIQPDSVLPKDQNWSAQYCDFVGKRVKAKKIRGEWSEGLVVPLSDIDIDGEEGEEVSEKIGVTKYEVLCNDVQFAGNLPYGIPKTDEERHENVKRLPFGQLVTISLKIDGQSSSFFYNRADKRFGVLARKYEIHKDSENAYTAHLKRYPIEENLSFLCETSEHSYCIRGESYGRGIQKGKHNPHSQLPPNFAAFSIWDIEGRNYVSPRRFSILCSLMGIPTVPILERDVVFSQEIIEKYSVGLKEINCSAFEGVVVSYAGERDYYSFKILNKHYDSKK